MSNTAAAIIASIWVHFNPIFSTLPKARKHLADDSILGCFHCISRCVHRAFLCGDDAEHRSDWVRDAIRSAAEALAVDVLAYAVMRNHIHLVVRTDPVRVADWSADTVARRWAAARKMAPERTPLDPPTRKAGLIGPALSAF